MTACCGRRGPWNCSSQFPLAHEPPIAFFCILTHRIPKKKTHGWTAEDHETAMCWLAHGFHGQRHEGVVLVRGELLPEAQGQVRLGRRGLLSHMILLLVTGPLPPMVMTTANTKNKTKKDPRGAAYFVVSSGTPSGRL